MAFLTQGGSQVGSAQINDGAIVNADINANAAISISKLSNSAYALLASVTLVAPGLTLNSGTFTGKRFLRVIIDAVSYAGAGSMIMQFNGDTGANYDANNATDGGASGKVTGQTSATILPSAGAQSRRVVLDIINIATLPKRVIGDVNADNTWVKHLSSWTNSTDLITSILITASQNMGTGSSITVLGMD